MPGPYFQREPWPAFTYLGVTYSFDHLCEFQFSAIDSEGIAREIAVTFTDHCFTKKPGGTLDPALRYPPHVGGLREFCFDRYALSRELPKRVVAAAAGKVWMAEGKNFVVAEAINHSGRSVYYVVIFGLRRVKSLPVNLHLRVETAYPVASNPPNTYGSIPFARLITRTMQGKPLPKITDRGRRRLEFR